MSQDVFPTSQWQLDLGVERRSDGRVLAALSVAAVMTDLAVRSGVAGVAGSLLVVVVAASALASGRLPNRQAQVLVAASAVFGAFLTVRMSPALLPLDILAAGMLLIAGASLASRGSAFDLSLPQALSRAVHALGHGLAAPAFVIRTGEGDRSGALTPALLRGLAVAVPVLVILGLLLGSADPVFAGFFRWSNPETIILHAALLTVGAWGMAGLLRLASAHPVPATPNVRRPLGPVEATVVLGSLVTLFTAFAVAQLLALSAGGRHVIETSGLTYAQYARSGFFQLLAVAAITLLVLLAVQAATQLDDVAVRRRIVILAEAAVVLTLVVVLVALRRLGLYEEAFGLTMLRLYSQVFAVWVAVVFVALGLAVAGVGRGRAWFPAAAVVAGLVALLVLNVANPEALVVRHNVDHATRTGRFDPGYLAGLSDDAVPALVSSLSQLPAEAQATVRDLVCGSRSVRQDPSQFRGWAAWNHSREQAEEARAKLCHVPQP
ncbi:MAG: DUF4173 domain-containing protein [Actinobacteria bacterium]|nr:DUF4173 domain-containing protein [Actinomycetota bacterium]